ncbi:MAG: GGDEF domain-containing protein [Spirochaetes bacterium]|nr:GGDEF domain-containing protein [Spirochaetota bacterium]
MSKKNKSGFGGVVASICIMIYLFALIQAAVRVYLSFDKCKGTAESEFTRIATLALQTGTQGFMDSRFVEQINTALSSSNILEALIITGPEGEYAFEREQGYAITWANNSPRFIKRFSFSSQSYYRPLPIQNIRNVNIKAVARAFDYNEILKVLKETLLLILAGFAIAFFTMLLQLLLGKPESVQQTINNAAYSERQYERDSERDVENYFTAEEKTQDFSSVSNTPYTADETIPKGLYSPRSNIGWQEYINDRLNSELYRCSSTENDLTLVLIEFMDLKNDEMYRQAAEETASFFSSRDLLFEYGRYGIAVILPGIDLGAGISKLEKFYQRITGKFPHNKKGTQGICIGLSSRSGRLLNAGRLILECREALEKAKYDPNSSIIAFKSDPEKYRAFIASQN